MKIGILTFHREINDGSVLQAYCLYRLFAERFSNAKIELIDYLPTHVRKKRQDFKLRRKFPFFRFDRTHMSNMSKRISQDQFYRSHLALSPALVLSDELDRAVQAIEGQHYDAIICGSDTVWDTRPNSGGPQAPNVFFLPGFEHTKKIAFAASMDKGGPSFVSKPIWHELIDCISHFQYISVRDRQTHHLLSESGIANDRLKMMPDPTLLYDFSGIVEPPKLFLQRFENLAGVALSDQKLKSVVTEQLLQKGYTVINLLGARTNRQISPNPKWSYGQRLGIYAGLDFLVTDRFHGSILALKQSNNPVMMVEPDYFYPENNSKGRDLFERLGIDDMVWRYEKEKPISSDLIVEYHDIASKYDWAEKTSLARIADEALRCRLPEICHILSKNSV